MTDIAQWTYSTKNQEITFIIQVIIEFLLMSSSILMEKSSLS